jgi:signal transduction histidine kinase
MPAFYFYLDQGNKMKRKLSIAFTLITLSLIGIVVFQGYWTVNDYRIKKKLFDSHIDSALLRAMDDCKKDYFDSIRVVIIKRLSSADFVIKIDTLTAPDPSNTSYDIWVADKSQSAVMIANSPFTIRKLNLDYYKTKMHFKGKQSIPALLTEMSFYVPAFLYYITNAFEFAQLNTMMGKIHDARGSKHLASSLQQSRQNAIEEHNPNPFIKDTRDTAFDRKMKMAFREHNKKPRVPGDTSFTHNLSMLLAQHVAKLKADEKNRALIASQAVKAGPVLAAPADTSVKHSVSLLFKQEIDREMPPNYHQADSIKIYRYLKKELEKVNIDALFVLSFTRKSNPVKTFNSQYSETNEFAYKYHGFAFLSPNRTNNIISYTKAVFKAPQYSVMKSMLIDLSLSLLLILLTGFCFLYVYRTILEQKNLAILKDDFINNMTHELKTPIATITVAIEGLQNFNVLNDPEKTQRYLQTSREQLDRLNELVTKVLNVAAFENKDIDLHIQEVNVDDMINNIITSEKVRTKKQVNISYINQDNVATIYADKLHLNNVLLNLVDNAIKYAGDTVDVDIKVYRSEDHVVFSVKDNGIGIPAEHINQIFDKFYRVPTGNIHNIKGTGLGLSYVKYIAEAHGGTITVKSNIGTGSEFIVTLPLVNG